MAAGDDDLPPLDDFSEVLASRKAPAAARAAPPMTSSAAAPPAAAAAPVVAAAPVGGGAGGAAVTAGAAASLRDREFLTDWGTPEQEALQKQMIDAALARNPDYIAEKAAETAVVTANFGKATAIKKGFLLGGKKAAAPAAGGAASTTAPGSAARGAVAATSAAAAAATSALPLVRPTAPAGGGSTKGASGGGVGGAPVFDEVQAAMNEHLEPMRRTLERTSEWLTGDLMAALEKEPRLKAAMSNPRTAAALEEFQRDPRSAMLKYKDDAMVTETLRTFAGMLGEHFTKLSAAHGEAARAAAGSAAAPAAAAPASRGPLIAEVSGAAPAPAPAATALTAAAPLPSTATAAASRGGGSSTTAARSGSGGAGGGGRLPTIGEDDDAEVRRILSDPVLSGILRDPAMQRVMEDCRRDGSKLAVHMRDPETRRKLLLMQRAGLIRIEM